MPDIPSFFRAFSFMIPVTLEIFLPCYFGNELSSASSKLSMAFFHSDWIDEGSSLKSLGEIFMENTKQDLKISAFGVFDANLSSFGRIANSAYSLFAVLRRINK